MLEFSFFEVIITLFKANLSDSNSIVLLRFYLRTVRAANIQNEDSLFREIENLIDLQLKSGLDKIPYYYNHLASCYVTLGRIAQLKNKFSKSKAFYERGIEACDAGALKNIKRKNSEEMSLFLLTKKSILLNNIGGLVYQLTNHQDPLEKRNQVGPIIERYWLKADSIDEDIIRLASERKEPSLCMGSSTEVLLNLMLLYGYYYPNEVKAQFYYDKLFKRAEICGGDNTLATLDVALGWIKFSKREFRECVPYFRNFLKKNSKEVSAAVQDSRYALTESYYHLNVPDSVISFGNEYLRDTTYVKDYLFLSMSSTYMTEMYLELGERSKAKEFLKLSKTFMARSQHEAILREYRKEGEEIMLQAALVKISELSDSIEKNERNVFMLQISALAGTLILALLASAYFIGRLRGTASGKRPD